MIAVDVYVPYLGTTYDFNLDDRAPISSLINEIAAMICLKERWPMPTATDDLALFCPAQMQMLAYMSSLYQEGIRAGQSLILC